jgi:hypothetical protein
MIVQLVRTLISCIKNGNSSFSPGYFHILSCFLLLLLIFSAVAKYVAKHPLENMSMQASAEKDEASARGAVFC